MKKTGSDHLWSSLSSLLVEKKLTTSSVLPLCTQYELLHLHLRRKTGIKINDSMKRRFYRGFSIIEWLLERNLLHGAQRRRTRLQVIKTTSYLSKNPDE